MPHLVYVTLLACGPTSIQVGETQPVDSVVDSDPPPAVVSVHLNELMVSNRSAVTGPTGGSPDWVELVNLGDDPVDLDGWTLVSGDQDASTLRDLVLEPGAHVVLWADGRTGLGPHHLGFTLLQAGGTLTLNAPDGALHDAIAWPIQATDVAAARLGDGVDHWVLTAEATPGAANPAGNGSAGGTVDDAPLCDLSSDLDDPYLWEGDAVGFTLTCDDDLSLDDADVDLIRAPADATLEGRSVTWQTGPADGGRHDVVFSVRPAGALAQIPEAGTVTVWVADDPALPDAQPVTPVTYTEEWGLPVVHIDVGVELEQTYVDAVITFEGVVYQAEAKVRGASSTSYPKRSYTLDFDNQELQVQGWDTREHLVLTSTFDDNSYVRQKLVFDLWQAMATFWGETRLTPRTFFAVVYIDGVYQGLYTATDPVDEEFASELGFTPDGDLYKSVNHDANFMATKSNGSAKGTWHDGWEKKEGADESDFSNLDDFVEWVASSELSEIVAGLDDRAAAAEFMDWYLLVHFSESTDSAGKNAYLYVPEPAAPRFHVTPWDFNASWGQNWYTARSSSAAVSNLAGRNRIFYAYVNDPDGSAALWDRYAAMRTEGPLHPDWFAATLATYRAQLGPNADRDWARWQDEYRSFSRWSGHRSGADDWTDYAGESAYVDQWIAERFALFDAAHPVE